LVPAVIWLIDEDVDLGHLPGRNDQISLFESGLGWYVGVRSAMHIQDVDFVGGVAFGVEVTEDGRVWIVLWVRRAGTGW
jgi:hypothetical protein